MSRVTDSELKTRMFYTRPDEETVIRHRKVQEAAFTLGLKLVDLCPNPSRELSIALTKLEECRMWANAAIAHRQKESEELGVTDYPSSRPVTSEKSFESDGKKKSCSVQPQPWPEQATVGEAPEDEGESDPFTGLPTK